MTHHIPIIIGPTNNHTDFQRDVPTRSQSLSNSEPQSRFFIGPRERLCYKIDLVLKKKKKKKKKIHLVNLLVTSIYNHQSFCILESVFNLCIN